MKQLSEMNWMQVEEYLTRNDLAILPVGSAEQHAYLSLATDTILAERVAVEAAEGEDVLIYPALPFGIAPYFAAFPGSVNVRMETYLRLLGDLFDSMRASGFRRILVVNGHGGNIPGATFAIEWMADHPDVQIKWHNWWAGPEVMKVVQSIDPTASHASWMENFPWTRLPGVDLPEGHLALPDIRTHPRLVNQALRDYLGAGNFGGYWQRSDEEIMRVWAAGVAETRSMIVENWHSAETVRGTK